MTHGNSLNAGWTDERTATLKRLWLDGLSAREIAKQLGGVTRNAVLGKVDRIGLGSGTVRKKSTNEASARRRATAAAREGVKRAYKFGPQKTLPGEGKPPTHVSLDVPTATDPVPLLQRTIYRCAWPLGEPSEQVMLCCGSPVVRGSYCAAHGAVAYVPLTARQRDADKGVERLLRRAA